MKKRTAIVLTVATVLLLVGTKATAFVPLTPCVWPNPCAGAV